MSHFIKRNHSPHSQALIAEAHGLETLRQLLNKHQSQLKVPEVFQVNEQQMTLTQIQTQHPSTQQYALLGHELAQLHVIEQAHCGFKTDNFIGLNPQKNTITDNWGEFFWQYRLKYQLDLIKDNSIRKRFAAAIAASKSSLIDCLMKSCSHFSLLHGDLWSGNVLFDEHDVWLIDPAVYYGDAEADVAMTELFGGFPEAFYSAYFKVKPRTTNYSDKKIIYNLYHQLNHYNLFGDSFLPSCHQAIGFINKSFGN